MCQSAPPAHCLLDEPTAESTGIGAHLGTIYELAQASVTVCLLFTVRLNTGWLALIDAKLVASGPTDLRRTHFHARLLELDAEATFRWRESLEKAPGIEEVAMHGNRLHLTVKDPAEAERQIRQTGEQLKLSVTSIREITPSLEDIFVSVITRQRVG
jgi:ABC-2 type transport system ATP-binding protein